MRTRFEERPFDAAVAKRLTASGMLPALARVLAARGIRSVDDLAEDWKSLADPTLLEGLDTAADIVCRARKTGQRITIVADYDCDGATACAVAVRGLKALGIRVDYIVPDRFKYGYGLSPEIVDLALSQPEKPDILLTVDNGITSVDGVDHANALGLTVIITDHHLAGKRLPNAGAIVNPNLVGNRFPSKALAGCGVMYYLLLAVRARLRQEGVFSKETQPRLDALSDLVALGTVADVVALDKNNRILVSRGLARVRQGKACAGIQALFDVCGHDRGLASVKDFAFSIAPRINAAGRLTEMGIGIDCLLTDDAVCAQEYARELDRLNSERRSLEEGMQNEAFALIQDMDVEKKAGIVLFNPTWHQGVVGLVASRIKEAVHRPVIAFAPDEGEDLKGSGRSIDGLHLRDILEDLDKKAPGLMKRYGGHAMAAGLTIKKENLTRFTSLFDAVVRGKCDARTLENRIVVDGPLAADEINFVLIDALESRIWGQGFEAPIFANEFTVLNQRVLKGSHLKLFLELEGKRFDAIFFRHATPLPSRVRLAYKPEVSTFMGRRSPQLIVVAAEQ